MRNTPWFYQRRSESAPPAERPKAPPVMTMKEQDEITDRLSRPTESAMYRQSLYWKLDTFMDRGFHSWSKMDLFSDSKRCMWTPDGTIKGSCKIRPVNVERMALPPLQRAYTRGLPPSRQELRSREVGSSASSDREGPSCRRSITTPLTDRSSCRRNTSRSMVHWRRADPWGGRGQMVRPIVGVTKPIVAP